MLPALEQHGRLQLGQPDRDRVLVISAATIDRLLVDVKIAASGGRRRRAGFYSAIRREVPIRTFNDWNSPPPGFCEVDMVAHGGTSVAGSFIQTLTMVDVATGWTECLPLVTREGSLVVEAINRAQSLFPWLLRGVDFDNDSAFMNDVVVPWCREQKLEVTRSRAYKKNDQAFVEQKNGAVVRRLMGYGRFDGVETARVMGRLYAAARLYVNFFQPSFKLKEKRREGAKVIKRYHLPSTPYERALAHPKVTAAVKKRLRDQYRSLDPVALLAEIRATQDELAIASIVVPDRCAACNPPARAPRQPPQPLLRRRSARRRRPASHVPHTGAPVGPIKPGFACRPSSTRILLRSRAGSVRNRS
ncbi:DDE-type integrase/transposase/recombinase [Bradyrhizobium sp. WSM4349]|uniref:integrase catalytic domain-containing protein n=1 Tax=Bradyrhizobium sp. WSM4349 TaxID=1040988 RepID=UPI0018E01256|nr:DDE-type integrase/transposase/recombinase [Bradyrhizobium sp. WSM4349]